MYRGDLTGCLFARARVLRAPVVAALVAIGVLGVQARASAQNVAGNATGIQGSLLDLLGTSIPIAPTPHVELPPLGGTADASLINLADLGLPLLDGLLQSGTLTVRTTSAFDAAGTPIPVNTGIYSEARVENLNIGAIPLLLPPVLSAQALTVTCRDTPTGLVGGMDIASLNVLGVPLALPPLPNLPPLSIELLPGVSLGSLALNQQQMTTGPGGVQTLTVTGIDLTLLQILTLIGGVDLELLQVQCSAAPPTSTSLDPGAGPSTGGTPVTVTGTGFLQGATLTFDGTPASNVVVVSSTTITALTPPHAPATVPVVVTTAGGTATTLAFTYLSTPTLTGLNPTSGPLAGGNAVTLTGADFGSSPAGVSVTFGGMPATVNTVTPTSITVTAPPGAAPGPVPVIATTPGGTTAPQTYTYFATPAFTGLNPTSGPLAGGNVVTLTGSDFGTDPALVSVSFGPAAATVTGVTPTTITVTAPAGAAAGPVSVTATTPGGTTGPQTYTYFATPAFTGLNPTSGPLAGGNVVTLTGSDFGTDPALVSVSFGPAAATVTGVTPTTITVTAPAGAAAGPVSVTATTPGGTTGPQTYTYFATPAFTGLNPTSGPLAGGNVVTLTGSDFGTDPALVSVSFGPAAATVTGVTPTIITVTAPAGAAAGPVSVTATTPGGTTGPQTYTYFATPAFTSLDPTSGPLSGGNTVTLTGSDFGTDPAAVTVTFGAAAATITTVTPTSIVVVAPAGVLAGPVSVALTTPGGPGGPLPYTYLSTTNLESITPSSGPSTGGTPVLIKGLDFLGGATVTFNGTSATDIVVVNSTTITARSPAGTPGAAAVIVTSGGGTASGLFTYISVPTITSVTPNTGDTGTPVTIIGSQFAPGATVTICGQAIPAQFVSPTDVRFIAPACPAGGVQSVTITNPDGGTTTAPDAFTYSTESDEPTLTAVTPDSGPKAGGTSVTITGTKFVAGSIVTFGETPATNVVVVDANTITATSPAYTANVVDAGAQAAGTQAAGTQPSETQPSGTQTPAAPTSAPAASANALPPHVAGIVDVTVTTPNGSATLPDSFSYLLSLPPDCAEMFELDPNDVEGDPDGDGLTNFEECTSGPPTHPKGFFTRYLAEGAANSFFSLRFAIFNPGATKSIVLLQFLQSGGGAFNHVLTVNPHQRITLDPTTLTGFLFTDFSTTIESDAMVIVDRQMTWDNLTHFGSHAETAVASLSTTWYLAEGSTSDPFSLFYLLQNPHPTQTIATIRYLRALGEPPLVKVYNLPPKSRTTIFVDREDPGLIQTDVSGVIEATQTIAVERAMYLDQPDQLFAAGHDSAGVTAPATEWFLAEGATGPFFELFVLIANPNPTPAQVRVDYLQLFGSPLTKVYTVPGNARFTIWVDEEELPLGSGLKPLANVAVSTRIRSENNVPIFVERAMWWPQPVWYEAHNSPATTETGTQWALAEGETGGPAGNETYVLIANVSDHPGQANVTLYFEDGTTTSKVIALPQSSRVNVQVTVDFPEALGKRFATIVESLGPDPAALVVERAMYASPGGQVWGSGTNAVATRLQ